MRIQIITLFPEIFDGVLNTSMLRKAQQNRLVKFQLINLRDFGVGPRKQVDDIPYGGGDGMVLKPEPLINSIEYAKKQVKNGKPSVILMTPRGEQLTQEKAQEISRIDEIILVCGRYEGYDERITDYIDEQISIGKYIVTGGEIPAMIVADAVTRLVPGVLGGPTSAEKESYSEKNVIEHPHYTRPKQFRSKKVPDVLLSGNHSQIETWRAKNSIIME